MDRREFFKTTFAASVATFVLPPSTAPGPHADDDVRIDASLGRDVSVWRGDQLIGTTALRPTAEYVLRRLRARLTALAWPTTLSELDIDTWKRQIDHAFDGHKIGEMVWSFAIANDNLQGPQPVTLTDQVFVMFAAPRRITGKREPVYRVPHDDVINGPDLEPLPLELALLDGAVEQLVAQIIRRRINVFSAGLYMPKMQGGGEGAYGLASRSDGLALRVVRVRGPEHDLLMRIDLLGGTFPTESVHIEI